MTEFVHDTSVPVDVFPDEFFPLLKVINCAISMPEKFALTDDELEKIRSFQNDFTDTAFEHGV
jgi:hypothetical protein